MLTTLTASRSKLSQSAAVVKSIGLTLYLLKL